MVCSVGVDLDLVPYAIDARLAALHEEGNEPGAAGEVWLVTPPRDLVPVTAELAALADQPLSLVPFSGLIGDRDRRGGRGGDLDGPALGGGGGSDGDGQATVDVAWP